jgi:hypothetical protein
MMNNRSVAVSPGFWQRSVDLYQRDARVRFFLQAIFLTLMGALSALLKSISPGIGVPGSSAVLWLGPLVLARMSVKRGGAGAYTGICVALWGIPLGINNGFMHNLALFGVSGLALDLVCLIPFINITNPVGAVICGMVAHLVKFGYIFSASLVGTSAKHFILFGILKSFGLHILFGAMAGIAAWLIYRTWKAEQDRRHKSTLKAAL